VKTVVAVRDLGRSADQQARALPPVPPAGQASVPVAQYEAYRATAQYVSPDGETIQFATGLKAGDPSTTAALKAMPSLRAEAAAVAKTLGASKYGVGGEAPAANSTGFCSRS
jgi:hypothetical protein